MVFNSVVFLVFLAVVLTLYYNTKLKAQNIILVVAGYVFYGWWDWRFLGLLLATTFFDYTCALWIDQSDSKKRRKILLASSMVVNLSVLGFFKYFNFFADSFSRVLETFGMRPDMPTLEVILPLGISFYTFLSMSYTIDVYRGRLKASHNPLDFMLYVSFFPHLVAGPIVRAQDLLPQCRRARKIDKNQVLDGIWLCLLGYLKKIVIADRLAPFVDWGFSSSTPPLQNANAWLFLFAFAFQIYGDFSGYTDIARGLAKMMGFELMKNFKAPYFVSNPSDFWKNWHISLSAWLRDYLYIPLGGNRLGNFITFRNLMITMLLGGLWHGAGFAFLAWGLFHGILLVIHRIAQEKNLMFESRVSSFVSVVVFFHITCIGWLLFRAGAVPADQGQWQTINGFLSVLWVIPDNFSTFTWPVLLLGGMALAAQWHHNKMEHFSQWHPKLQAACVAGTLAAISFLGVFEGSSFIYFQF